MYWEGGVFNGSSELQVVSPNSYLRSGFRQWDQAGGLLPLSELLVMPRAAFYVSDWTRVYSQAGMFVYYLMKVHGPLMQQILGRMRDGDIRTNGALLQALITGTAMSLTQLDQAYTTLARSYPP